MPVNLGLVSTPLVKAITAYNNLFIKYTKLKQTTGVMNPKVQSIKNEMTSSKNNLKKSMNSLILSQKKRLDELEFHYPVKDIQLKKLQKLFLAHYSDGFAHDYSLDLEKLNYRMEEGYFNGSIDLSFQKDGKF